MYEFKLSLQTCIMIYSYMACCSCRFHGRRKPSPHLHNIHALRVRGYIQEETLLSLNFKDIRSLSLQRSILITYCDTVSKAKFSIPFQTFPVFLPVYRNRKIRQKNHIDCQQAQQIYFNRTVCVIIHQKAI